MKRKKVHIAEKTTEGNPSCSTRRKQVEALGVMKLARALAIISVFLVVALAAPAVVDMFSDTNADSGTPKQISQRSLLLSSFEGIEKQDGSTQLPADFEVELFDTSRYKDINISADTKVIGMLSDDAPEQALSLCSTQMQEKGWQEVPSGYAGCSTFIKDEGSYRWAMISCLAVAGMTSIVIQVT